MKTWTIARIAAVTFLTYYIFVHGAGKMRSYASEKNTAAIEATQAFEKLHKAAPGEFNEYLIARERNSRIAERFEFYGLFLSLVSVVYSATLTSLLWEYIFNPYKERRKRRELLSS